jgi:predicted outer membrane protein
MLHPTLLALLLAAAPLMAMLASDDATLSERDDAFIHQFLNSCATEIRTAEAALKRPVTESERNLAQQVIDTHHTMQQALRTIARTKHLATKDEVQADEQGHIVHAGEVTDKDFNAFFLRGEITSLSAEIGLCDVELRDGTDEDLTLFSRTYLPSLQQRLIVAKEFAAKY